jgi:hypothetical protein
LFSDLTSYALSVDGYRFTATRQGKDHQATAYLKKQKGPETIEERRYTGPAAFASAITDGLNWLEAVVD